MADDADIANDLQETFLQKSLERTRSRSVPVFTGKCLYCEDPIEIGRFCDSHCRESHEQEMRKYKR